MLLNNYINNTGLGREYGRTNPYMYFKNSTCMQFYTGNHVVPSVTDKSGFPTATEPPYSFLVAPKGSLLSSTTLIDSTSDLTSGLSMGINIEANLDGSSTITTANLSLVVQLASNLVGSGDITTANLVGTIALAATLAGTGSLTAGLSLIASMNSNLTGSTTISGALLTGIASMEATIYVNQSEATVQQLVEGVWNALTADFNNANTMGEVMNNMGAASDPWGTTLPGAYAAGEAGHIIGNLLSNIPASVWDELKTTHTTASTYGKIVQDLETLSRQIKALTAAGL